MRDGGAWHEDGTCDITHTHTHEQNRYMADYKCTCLMDWNATAVTGVCGDISTDASTREM